MNIKSLKEVIQFNSSFKTAVNLYLSLNKTEKVLNYIPTKSSVTFINDYFKAVLNKKEQATLLVGPYGKGKSHLLLVLLAVLSLERNEENEKVIDKLCKRFSEVDEVGNEATENIRLLWNRKRLLPVIINDSNGDLNQAFLSALNDALKRDGLGDLVPDTYYSIALERIADWEKNYPDTYAQFVAQLKKNGFEISNFIVDLKRYSKEALDRFVAVYPLITAGSTFNPLAVSEVLPLYKSVSEKLVEEKNYDGLYIVFDEFSKFIEGLNGSNAGNNMKLLQDICELANDSDKANIFITMVAHKSIKEYGRYLSNDIINAFTGIEGRIIEKFFVTSSKNNYELIKQAIVKNEEMISSIPMYESLLGETALQRYQQLPVFSGTFETKDFEETILKGCYPLNPVAAYLLLNISEKVAQNERTLFTFISNDEPNSMARFVSEHSEGMSWAIGAELIYDYFSGLFKKEVSNELIHNIWLGAEAALSKCVSDDERKVVKAIAIIQIVNKEDEIIANEKYISLAVDCGDAADLVDALVARQVIYVKGSTGALVFKTKAGTELRAEIKRQREIKGDVVNCGNVLEKITDRYFVTPRKYNTIHAMTRYFKHEYMEVESFLSISSADVLFDASDASDGKVICLYSFSATKQAEVKKHLKELNCPKLVVVAPKQSLSVSKHIKEYDILQDIRANQTFIANNEIIKREIVLLEEDIETIVMEQISQVYLDDSTCLVLYYDGSKMTTYKAGSEETAVNDSCEKVYFKTPLINNEIINKANITTAQTRKARINIISEILASGGNVDESFYEGTNQEATVFRSLFVRTGVLEKTPDTNISEVLDIIDGFVDSCCDKKVLINELVEKLTNEPYGMRLGVIPVYMAYMLARRNEDLVVYLANTEVQLSADVIVNMCESAKDYSLFVPKADKEREDYIKSLNELFSVQESRNLTDNRIKNIVICMQRWFRSLPQVSRNAANISEYKKDDMKKGMLLLKKVLQRVEINPYEIVFVTIPNGLNTQDYKTVFSAIKECKEAYDGYFDWMNSLVVSILYKIFGEKSKLDLFHVLKEWYEKQSSLSKQGLVSGKITSFMSCIENIDVYDDNEVAKKIAKAVTDVYMDNWSDGAVQDFERELISLKTEIESIKEGKNDGQHRLSFVGKKGNEIERYYETVSEGTGSILRNILEDTLDEFDDLSVNDRVGILLEMIEKIIG